MKISEKRKNIWIVIGTAGAVYFSFKYLLPLVVPFVLAFAYASMLRPLANWLHRKTSWDLKKCNVGLAMGIFVAVITVLGYLTVTGAGQLKGFLRQIPTYMEQGEVWCEEKCCHLERMMGMAPGTAEHYLQLGSRQMEKQFEENFLPRVSHMMTSCIKATGKWLAGIAVFIIASVLLAGESSPRKIYPEVTRYLEKVRRAGIAYCRTQGIIVSIVSVINVLGLMVLKVPYSLVIGLLIGVVDAFPIVGSGCILVPWGLIQLLEGEYFQAAILFTLYVINLIVREFLEPHLMGKGLGIKPLYVLLAVYVGIKLFGMGGIILGPIGFLIIQSVAETKLQE